MDRKRIKECCAKYTKDTKTVTKFLKKEAASTQCPEKWLEAPSSNGRRHQYVLKLSNLKSVARHLVEQDDCVVPVYIMEALDRVVGEATEDPQPRRKMRVTSISSKFSRKSASFCSPSQHQSPLIRILQRKEYLVSTEPVYPSPDQLLSQQRRYCREDLTMILQTRECQYLPCFVVAPGPF